MSYFEYINLRGAKLIAQFVTVVGILSLITVDSFAQTLANYSVTRSTGIPYNSVFSSGFAVPAWRYSGGFSQDDNRSFPVEIGFDFWYNGTRYTSVSVSTNGFIDFSASTDNGGPTADDFGYWNNAFTSTAVSSATRPAIAPIYDDMTAQGGVDPLGNSIRYQLSGVAPNRVFTIEWKNMAVYLNTSPNLNFQVKLHETSGRIELVYGDMVQGTHNFSYTCGMNGNGFTNSAANLRIQQNSNSSVFSNGIQNNLTTLPASNSQISFEPPVPGNPGSALTFSSITQTSMLLNWTDWASNEVGYVIYFSEDGINYSFYSQTPANTTSEIVSGLLPGVTYYFQLRAVTEGALSLPLSGNQATLPAGIKYSNTTSGNWSQNNAWTPPGVPTSADNVIIRDGHTIILNVNGICNDLTVGEGGSGGILRIGRNNNNVSRTLTVNSNLVVETSSALVTNTSSNTTHQLVVGGKIRNDGIINMSADGNSLCHTRFVKNGNTTITGNPIVNNFFTISLELGNSRGNELLINTPLFSATPNNFLTLNAGTFHLVSSNTSTFSFTTNQTINPNSGLVNSNPSATWNFRNNLTLQGGLELNSGVINVGDASNEFIESQGGNLVINGGKLNISGRFFNSNINTISVFDMSGGTITVPTISSTNTSFDPFFVNGAGSRFNMTSGRIIIPREGGNGAQNLGFRVTGISQSNITGGIVQIGDPSVATAQQIRISSEIPLGELEVNGPQVTAFPNSFDLNVVGDISILQGTLDAAVQDIFLGGNWNNNSVFIPRTRTVTFNGSGNQSLQSLTPTEGFFNLSVDGGDVMLGVPVSVTNDLTLLAGSLDVGAASHQVSIQGDFTVSGTFIPRNGEVRMNGNSRQEIAANSPFEFYDLRIINPDSVLVTTGNVGIQSALFLDDARLRISSGADLTLLSNASQTARLAPVPVSSTISGNVTVQRFISGRNAGYSDLSAPVLGAPISDWSNELNLWYGYNPPVAYPSAYTYDESLWDFVPVTSGSTVLLPGQGVELWLDSYFNYTLFDPTVVDIKGQLFTGDLDLSSSLTRINDGWNLIGNPYASHISLDALLSSSGNIGGTVLYYDEVIDDYNTLTVGSGIEIAPHQGFWVEALTNSPTLFFQESHKTTSLSSGFRNFSSTNNDFSLEVRHANGSFPFKGHAYLTINELSSLSKDDNDLSHLKPPHEMAPGLFFYSGNDPLRISSIPSSEKWTLPVGLKMKEGIDMEMVPVNVNALMAQGYYCISLLDTYTGKEFDLTNNPVIRFTSTSNDLRRFYLVISKNGDCEFKSETPWNAFTFDDVNGNVSVKIEEPFYNGSMKVYNTLGQIIFQIQGIDSGIYTIPGQGTQGLLLIELSDKEYSKTLKHIVR